MSVNIQTSSGLVKIAGTPTIDTDLSNVSKNPVQNKVVTEKFDEINNNLSDVEFLGWSVPNECPIQNYVDSNGNFHKRVGRVDLGIFNFGYSLWGSANVFSITLSDAKTNLNPKALGNLYTKKYTNDTPSNVYGNKKDKIICLNDDNIRIIDSSYTDAAAFRNAMQGEYLYYELEKEKTISVGSEVVTELKGDLSFIKEYITPTVSANTVSNYVVDLPSGIDSTWDCVAQFGIPYQTSDYIGRVFAFITEDNKLRINVKADVSQKYCVNVMFAKLNGIVQEIS